MGVAVADSDEKWKVRCKEAFSRCVWMPTLSTFNSADTSNFAACAGQSDCWNVSQALSSIRSSPNGSMDPMIQHRPDVNRMIALLLRELCRVLVVSNL